jgi:DtxR family Mn-dependent transcriptional regulator
MKTTAAVQDYLKTIYALETQGNSVTTSTIAARLGLSAPSVSVMVKRLIAEQFLEKSPGHQVTLTLRGKTEALQVVRRHRLLETFLARVLGFRWDEVHAEAEVLEHALSDRLEERIELMLEYPTHDPHGDPIPPKTGEHDEHWSDPLYNALPGTRFRVERVSDRDSAALRYLAELNIRPGVVIEVGERAPFGGPLWVSVDRKQHALGPPLAQIVHGTVVDVPK